MPICRTFNDFDSSCLDTQTWTLIEPDELKGVTLKEDEEIEFDTEKFSYCGRRGEDLDG